MLRTAALVTTLALVATGCIGGDDDDEGVTKEDFIEQADAVCADYGAQIEEAGEGLGQDATMDDVVALFNDEAIPLFREQVEELRALELPEADEDDLEELWDELESAIDETEQTVNEDPESLLSEDEDPFAEADAFAQEYGFQQCGSNE